MVGAFAMGISQGWSTNTNPFQIEKTLLSICLLLRLALQHVISISMTTKETFTFKKGQRQHHCALFIGSNWRSDSEHHLCSVRLISCKTHQKNGHLAFRKWILLLPFHLIHFFSCMILYFLSHEEGSLMESYSEVKKSYFQGSLHWIIFVF